MTRRRVALLFIAAAFAAIALVALRPTGEPGVMARDFEAYYSAGATWINGGNPYSTEIWNAESRVPGVVASRHEVLPYIGLPWALVPYSFLARLPYATAARIWEMLLGASLILVAVMLRALLKQSALTFTSTAVLLVSFVPITSDFGLGQAALVAYAATLLALATFEMPRIGWCAAVVASIQPNVALALAVGPLRRRALYALLVAAAFVYAIGAYATGAAWPLTYLRHLQAHGHAERFAAIQITPAAIAYGFGMPPAAAGALGTIVAVVCAAIGIVAILRRRDRPLVEQAAIACAAVPFIAGFFHVHDEIVAVLPIALLLSRARGWLWAATLLGASLISVNWIDFAQQPQAMAQDLLLSAAAFFACTSFNPARRTIAVAIVFAVFLAAGAWTGQTHRMPIWPNDMHGEPALRGAVAAVWNEEQLRTGLLSRDTATALLRSFALLGSALVFYATLNVDVHDIVERVD